MHKGRFVFTFVCAGLLALSGVVRASQSAVPIPPRNPAAPSTIAGKVTDSQGRPVEDAKVAVYRVVYGPVADRPTLDMIDETTTRADGGFSFSGDKGTALASGSCVIARKEGFALGWATRQMRGEQRFDITLEEPKEFGGLVVDEKGRPIVEAEVSVAAVVSGRAEDQQNMRIWMMPGFFHTKTDGSGRFVFADMPAGATFEFLVRKAGCAPLSTLNPRMMGPAKLQYSPGQAGIKLTLFPQAILQGIVVEKEGGRPVAGMTILAQSESQRLPFGPRPVIVSQADGTFRIGDLSAGSYTVQLQTSTGPTAEWVAEPVRVSLKAGETRTDIKLELTKGSFIEVLVKDNAGIPVERASVNLRGLQDRQSFSGWTDEKGLARVRVTPGDYLLSGVYGQGSGPQRPIRQPEQITVAEGETKRIEHVLRSAPKVVGIVRDEAGNPLAGVTFNVLPTAMLLRDEITSDAAGKFEVTWDPDMWGPQGTTFVLVARDEARNLAEAVDLDEQGGPLDLKLKSGAVVSGTVLGREDQPLAGARIRVMVQGSRWGAPLGRDDLATAASDGKFEVRALPPDRQYTVSATANGYGRRNVRIDPGSIQGNRFDAGEIKLTRADLSVSGVVVDANDKPVAGANVYGYGEDQPDPRMIQTDAEGKFAIQGVCPGPIRLQVNSRGQTSLYGFAQAEGGATDLRIVISDRSTAGRVNLMPPRAASLKGKPLPPLKDLGIDLPADAEGKMLLVCFWDMGQRPSRYCLTQLAARAAPLGEKGVRIVAVHAGQIEPGTLSQWIEKNKIPFSAGTISGDINKTKSAWGVSSLPHLILTDRKHTVVAEGIGLDDLDQQIEAAGR